MINEIQMTVDAIKQWPVIIQGAAGSALFALLSYSGQRVMKKLSEKLSDYSGNIRKENLYRELIQKKYSRTANKNGIITLTCIYQGLAFALRGFIFFALGIIFNAALPMSSSVGALGLLYYLFKAALWIEPLWIEQKMTDLELWQRIKFIEEKLDGKAADDTLEKIKNLSI